MGADGAGGSRLTVSRASLAVLVSLLEVDHYKRTVSQAPGGFKQVFVAKQIPRAHEQQEERAVRHVVAQAIGQLAQDSDNALVLEELRCALHR